MKSYLSFLRNKSDEEKQRITRISALIGTGILVCLWIIIRIVVSEFEATQTQEDISQSSPSSEYYLFDSFNTLLDPGIQEISQNFTETQNTQDELLRALELELAKPENNSFFEDENRDISQNNNEPLVDNE